MKIRYRPVFTGFFEIQKDLARLSDCYLSYTKYDKMKFSSGFKYKSFEALYKPYAKS